MIEKDRSNQQSTTHFGRTVPVSGPARVAVIELLLLAKYSTGNNDSPELLPVSAVTAFSFAFQQR
jgi:hypothetical protein